MRRENSLQDEATAQQSLTAVLNFHLLVDFSHSRLLGCTEGSNCPTSSVNGVCHSMLGQTDVVVQAQNASQGKSEAGSDIGTNNVAGEQKKAVSWGTVKTHKVYAVEDSDEANGDEEVCTIRREWTVLP